MDVNVSELERTRLLLLSEPRVYDEGKVGRCPIGITLSRILGRQLALDDKHDIPELARTHLGLSDEQFDGLYRIGAWPAELRARWHEIPARREWSGHPAGHIADDEAEREQRAGIAAELLRRFIAEVGGGQSEATPKVKGRVRFSFGATDPVTVGGCPHCGGTHEHQVSRSAGDEVRLRAGCGRGEYLVDLKD